MSAATRVGGGICVRCRGQFGWPCAGRRRRTPGDVHGCAGSSRARCVFFARLGCRKTIDVCDRDTQCPTCSDESHIIMDEVTGGAR